MLLLLLLLLRARAASHDAPSSTEPGACGRHAARSTCLGLGLGSGLGLALG